MWKAVGTIASQTKGSRLVPQQSTELQRSAHLPTLDGWRAIAILGVLVCHAADAPLLAREGPTGFWYTLTRQGAQGVYLFFGLSGFLITYRLLQESERTGRIDLARFYGRRFFRILPACLAYLLAVTGLVSAGILSIRPEDLRSAFFFYRNYLVPAEAGSWFTGHFWTLAIEEHFYLLWPGLLVLAGRRRALWLCVGVSGVVAIWRWVELRFHPTGAWFPGLGVLGRTDIRIDTLLWGAFAALVLHEAGRERWLRERFASPFTWGALAVGTVVCLNGSLLPLNAMWWAMLVPLLLVGTVLQPGRWLGRVLETPVLSWVGRLSYSLYLWQQLFLVGSTVARPLPLGRWQELPLNLVAAFVCAILSHYLLERPLVNLGRRLFSDGARRPQLQPLG